MTKKFLIAGIVIAVIVAMISLMQIDVMSICHPESDTVPSLRCFNIFNLKDLIDFYETKRIGFGAAAYDGSSEICEKTVQHGFFLDVPVVEELVLDHIRDPKSRLALEIPFSEINSYRDFMIKNFGDPSPSCFVYEYEGKHYDLTVTMGQKSYFTHSSFPDKAET
ncbi:MAG: hypothetical protein J4F36_09505 [Nitrosopumilaceae archaeon]|nr:hypothetical protein [Nitrosopumilaceae archaeon]